MRKRIFQTIVALLVVASLFMYASPAYAAGYSFTITGNVKDASGNNVAGVVVTAVGNADGLGVDGTGTTGANGNYTMTLFSAGGAHWDGTLTPSIAVYTFDPTNHAYLGVTTSQTHDFTMNRVQLTGNVKDASGNNVAGVNLNAVGDGAYGSSAVNLTNASGNYSFFVTSWTNYTHWHGTIYATMAGYTFEDDHHHWNGTPPGDIGNWDATMQRVQLTGNVTCLAGNNIAGVLISANGDGAFGDGSDTTNANGDYSIFVTSDGSDQHWHGVITPTKAGQTFTPASYHWDHTPNGAVGNYDFVMNLLTLSGTVKNQALDPISGVNIAAVEDAAGGHDSLINLTDGAGKYLIYIPLATNHWHGVITPSIAGYSVFTPASKHWDPAGAGLNVQNFTVGWMGWNDNANNMWDTALPYVENPGINMSLANLSPVGDQGGCSVVAGFGAYQEHLLDNVPPTEPAGFYRVRVDSNGADLGSFRWAVLVRNALTNVELGCQVAVAGLVDMTVPAGVGVDVIITISNIGAFPLTGINYEAFVARNINGGGLIVDSRTDLGNVAGRSWEATNQANLNDGLANQTDPGNGTYYIGVWDTNGHNVNFLDVPNGTYNLGVADLLPVAEKIAGYYPNIVVGSAAYTVKRPHFDAIVPVDVYTIGPIDDLGVYLTPTLPGLNHDLTVGSPAASGHTNFMIVPGYHWDFADFRDVVAGGFNIFLYSKDFNPILGTLIFRTSWADPALTPFSYVDLCADTGYAAGVITLNPDGQLQKRKTDWLNDGTGITCAAGDKGGRLMLSPANTPFFNAPNYVVSDLILTAVDSWKYTYEPLGGPVWALDAFIYPPAPADPYLVVAGKWVIGDHPFKTTTTVSALNTNAPGPVTLTRAPWTDQFGNKVLGIKNAVPASVFPVYDIHYGVDDVETILDKTTWNITSFTNTVIGRYIYRACLTHGNLPAMAGPGTDCATEKQFAINPADVHYGTDWAYHFIMTNYEKGLTGGTTATAYSPYLNTDRGQMAAFLANGFVKIAGQTLPAYAGAFTDVSSTDWFAASVQYIKNLGITGGTGGGLYSPSLPVIRGDMAIFLETTGQAIGTLGIVPMAWDPALGTDLWYPDPITGSLFTNDPGIYNGWFTDVPASAYYATMAEEALADGLTSGCFAGTPYLSLQFCPTMIVDRSQMAVFLGRTWSLPDHPWWWTGPVPAIQN